MFEREIKFIYDFNLNKVNKLGPFFTFEQLLASDLHPAILQYISAEIDYLIFEDRQKLLKNSVFDYSGEKVSYHFNQISEEAKKTKRFALEYIAKLVLHASSFTVNYLVHPKWTIQKFIFDEDTTKTTNEIKQILNYVYYYKYLNKILISYINSKKILSMNVQEFEELLNKADKLGVETYLSAIIANALKSMAEFLNIGEIKKNKVPLSAVEMFLEEKELTTHLQKINEIFGNDESAKFPISDYEKVLNNVMIIKEEAMPEIIEEEKFEQQEIEEEKLTEISKEQEVSENQSVLEEVVEEEQAEDLEQEQEQEQEHEQEISSRLMEEQAEEKISEELDEKISQEKIINDEDSQIIHAKKLRIHINDDIKIEPIEESAEIKQDESAAEENEFEISDEINEMEADQFDDEKNQLITEEETESKENEDDEHLSFLFKQQEEELPEENHVEEEKIVPAEENIYENVMSESQTIEPVEDEIKNREITGVGKEKPPVLDLAEILEHKEMTKIIEVIYDYDIEDFANTLDEISNCRNLEDAYLVINQMLMSRRINRNSKEAETFREIISDYFDNR